MGQFEFPFTSDAGFKKVMEENDICRQVVSAFIGLDVQSVEWVKSEYSIVPALGAKGVRLDVLVKAEGRLVDVEMQRADPGDIARRMRYYQAAADAHTTAKGSPYRGLSEHFIVFACTFDPLGGGVPRYTFRMRAEEDPDVPFDPGFTWVILNTTAWARETDPALRSLLQYMDGRGSEGELCRLIDDVLVKAHGNPAWREGAREMMTIEQRIQWAEDFGEDKGMKKGLEQGRKQARTQLNAMNRWLMDTGRMGDLERSLSDPAFQQELLDEFAASTR